MNDLPTPATREEQFLSAAAGNSTPNDLPSPVTRSEKYLSGISGRVDGVQRKVDVLSSVKRYIGVTTTVLTEGTTTNPIIIDGQSITVINGDAATYNGVDFAFNGEIWQEIFAEVKELTQQEYDALPQSEKMDGTIYFITDTQSLYKNGIRYANDYAAAVNKPKINNVELSGNKTAKDLKLVKDIAVDDSDIEIKAENALYLETESGEIDINSAVEDGTDGDVNILAGTGTGSTGNVNVGANGDVRIEATGKAYYNGSTADDELATKGDLSGISSGIPDEGNSANVAFALTRTSHRFVFGDNYVDLKKNAYNWGSLTGFFNNGSGKKYYLNSHYVADNVKDGLYDLNNIEPNGYYTINLTRTYDLANWDLQDNVTVHVIGDSRYTTGQYGHGNPGQLIGNAPTNSTLILENVTLDSKTNSIFGYRGATITSRTSVILKNCHLTVDFALPSLGYGELIVEDCVFDGDVTLTPTLGMSITIKDNVFKGSTGLTLTAPSGTAYSGKGTITNNHFTQSGAGAVIDNTLTGIYYWDAKSYVDSLNANATAY